MRLRHALRSLARGLGKIMKTARMYSILAPAPERFDDYGGEPLTALPVERVTGKKWEAAVLGTPTTVRAVRITIPEIENETIDPEDFKAALKLRQFILDCIRLVYDPEAEYFRYGDNVPAMWNFLEPDAPPNFSVVIKQPLNEDYRVNVMGLAHMISALPALRPIIHLLANGSDPRMPLQFRFLSHYKIIEMHYRVSDNKRFREIAEPYVDEFRAIFPSVINVATLCTELARLRNKCAHIKLTTGDWGYSHPLAEPDDLTKVHKIVQRVAIRTVIVNYPNSHLRFAETPEQATKDFNEMAAAGLNPVKVV